VIRIRIGEGWTSDPEVRAGLRAGTPEPRRAAIRAIVDVVAIEVEGVDIAAGRTEGPVAQGVLGMLQALDRLAAGEEHASVPFEDGAVELLLHRRGGVALLSVATLSRPARLLAHDVEVDLPRLAEAARTAATAFCDRVAEIAPAARALPELRRLLRAAAQSPVLAGPGPDAGPATRARRTHRRRRDASCAFEIHDEAGRLSSWRGRGADLDSLLVRGRVSFRSPASEEFLSVVGAPYLTFRDLCAAAARMAAAPGAPVAFDLARPGRSATSRVTVADGAVSVEGAGQVRCGSLELAQAILEGTADFCAVVRRRAPAQGRNSLLTDLEASAAATLAQVREGREGDRLSTSRHRVRTGRTERPSRRPLGTGSLRRVSFRSVATADVGPPAGDGLLLRGEILVACGRERTLALDAGRGTALWSAPGAVQGAADDRAVVLLRGDTLEARDLGTGSIVWTCPAPREAGARSILSLPAGGRLFVASGPSVSAFDAARGGALWTFGSPGAARLSLLPLGPLLVVASDAGMVHALDPAGRVAWRLRGAGPLAAAAVGTGRSCLLSFLTPTGATLAAVDPSTGARLFEASLDFAPAGPPLRFAGRIAIAGSVAGDALVAALEEDGSPAWVEPSPTGGAPALAPAAAGLVAKGSDGTCAALDRDGRTLWLRSCSGRPAPPGNLAPVAARGVVLVAAEEVELLDASSGALVGRVPAHAPARLVVDGDLATWALDADGLLTGARVRGHLSLVAG
jgi:outer membrane protein assembly factor BamB